MKVCLLVSSDHTEVKKSLVWQFETSRRYADITAMQELIPAQVGLSLKAYIMAVFPDGVELASGDMISKSFSVIQASIEVVESDYQKWSH